MKPSELSKRKLVEILRVYKKFIGDEYFVRNYIRYPEFMLNNVRNCDYTIQEWRIGSRWTDDTKLQFRMGIDSEELEVLVYLNYNTKDQTILQEFDEAEKKFLEEASKILKN